MPYKIYLIVLITFLILGIISFLKQTKEGILAASIGGGICSISFIIHYLYYFFNKFLKDTGLTLKDIFMYIIYIAITCIVFLAIVMLIKFLGIKKR